MFSCAAAQTASFWYLISSKGTFCAHLIIISTLSCKIFAQNPFVFYCNLSLLQILLMLVSFNMVFNTSQIIHFCIAGSTSELTMWTQSIVCKFNWIPKPKIDVFCLFPQTIKSIILLRETRASPIAHMWEDWLYFLYIYPLQNYTSTFYFAFAIDFSLLFLPPSFLFCA